jgi:hypothetical protein
MSDPHLDPDTTNSFSIELASVNEGQLPLRDELTEFLGNSSVASSLIAETQAEVDVNKRNLILLQRFARMLPHAEEGRSMGASMCLGSFGFSGDRQQYLARQTQAHVVWVESDLGIGLSEIMGFAPVFIIGRAHNPSQPKSEDLLVIPAVGTPDSIKHNAKSIPLTPTILSVNRDDMAVFDDLSALTGSKEFNDEDISSLVNDITGNLQVTADTPGSVKLRARVKRGKSDPDSILSRGLRRTHGGADKLNGGPDIEIMGRFNVATHLAKLAAVFGFEDRLKTLIEQGVELRDPTVEELRNQNDGLRQALKSALVGSGLIDEQHANQMLSGKFPEL